MSSDESDKFQHELVLVRHGPYDFFGDLKQSCIPEIEQLAHHLYAFLFEQNKVSKTNAVIYSASMPRHIQTANIVKGIVGLPIELLPSLGLNGEERPRPAVVAGELLPVVSQLEGLVVVTSEWYTDLLLPELHKLGKNMSTVNYSQANAVDSDGRHWYITPDKGTRSY